MSFFDKLASPLYQTHTSKYALNHFLVYSRAKDSLKSAKKVVFFLICILAGRPMKGIKPTPPHLFPFGYATSRNL